MKNLTMKLINENVEHKRKLEEWNKAVADHGDLYKLPNMTPTQKLVYENAICNLMSDGKEIAFMGKAINSKEQDLIKEGTVTGDIATFDKMLMPLQRRMASKTIATEIFGTQPMTSSTTEIYAQRPVYLNNDDHPLTKPVRTKSRVLILSDGSSFSENGAISSSGTGAGVGTIRYIEGGKVLVDVTEGSFAVGDSVDSVASYTSEKATVSAIYLNEAQFNFLFNSYAKFATTALAEQAGSNIRQLGLVIDKTTVTAQNFKLKANYTRELVDDMFSSFNQNAPSEFVRLLENELVTEQNSLFIDTMNEKAIAGDSDTWNYGTSGTPGRWELERTFEMYSKVVTKADELALRNRMGSGNFIVCSLNIASKFKALKDYFVPSPEFLAGMGSIQITSGTFIGMLGNLRVYVDTFAPANYISYGFKGNEFQSGIYYCPYVPISMNEVVNHETNQPTLHFRTRYGIGENPYGAENFYGYISVTGL